MLVLFAVVVMIPLLVFTILIYSNFVDGVKANIEKKSQNELQAISDKVNDKLNQINNFTTLCRTDPEFNEIIVGFNAGSISAEEFDRV